MNLKKAVEAACRFGQFDGLFKEDGSCACLIDDLMPCGAPEPNCELGCKYTHSKTGRVVIMEEGSCGVTDEVIEQIIAEVK